MAQTTEGECSGMYRLPNGNLSVVHQHKNGAWFWYDETWATEYGPYLTEVDADDECDRYVREYLYNEV